MTSTYSARIESKFSRGVETQCKAKNCKLKLKGFPRNRIIINVDTVIPKPPVYLGKRCDRVIVVDESSKVFVMPVEFKTGNVKLSDVKEQLEGGTRFFQKHLPDKCRFYPVLVSKSITPQEGRKLEKVMVDSPYGKRRIRRVKCNNALAWQKVNNA